MARFRRGVNNAKVFPVDQGGYMAVSQQDQQPQLHPAPEFTQEAGVAPAKK
jgi:hypothetical protein